MRRLVVVLLVAAPAQGLTVKVDPGGGAPRIVVDGRPVRARMFWGGPGPGTVAVSGEWRDLAFEFDAASDATNGTLHFRFGQMPGRVWLDDVAIRDETAGRDVLPRCDFADTNSRAQAWTHWPTGERNTVGRYAAEEGALAVDLRAPPDGPWPDFHIYSQPRLPVTAGHRLRVTLRAKADPPRRLQIGLHRPGNPFLLLGAPSAFEEQIRYAAAAGAPFVSFPIGTPWPRPGTPPDWQEVDTACERVLRANAQALLIPRIGMDPPPWWRDAHPGAAMRFEDGSAGPGAVVAAPAYRRDAAATLAAMVAHLEEKFGDHIAGYHPCGQNTGEWFYHDTWKPPLSGYAPADLEAWRGWLKQQYPDDAALRRAWSRADAGRDTAAVPTPAERRAAPAGALRDPAKERSLIDWAAFQQEAMADCVIALARAVREASRGRKLVVFFYGYVFEFAPVPTGPAVSGHYALRRVLDCPDVDVLCSPIAYFDRGVGGGAPSMTAAESVALAGKLWLNEDDTHTYLATGDQPGSNDHVFTAEATRHLLARNVAQAAARNFGTWWMDLGSSGWFADPSLWEVMDRMRGLDEAFLRAPSPFRPEVGAVVDERSMHFVSAGGARAARPCVYEAREALGRMGAPYGQYLIDDLLAGRIDAKLVVLLNAWRLDASTRTNLLAALKGRTRIWCYAPGLISDHLFASPEESKALTGFLLREAKSGEAKSTAWATPTERGRARGLTKAFGVRERLTPLLTAADATPEETLATYPDGSAAVALRATPDGPSLFVGAPGLTAELLRLAAREGGVHLYAATDANIQANGPLLSVHASGDGPLALDLGRAAEATDALTGERVGQGPCLTVPMKRGETRILQLR